MTSSRLLAAMRWVKARYQRDADSFLKRASGVIHVGANTGQEREVYDSHGLQVVWIEPIPEIYERLASNIRTFSRQRALQCLITDRDDQEYEFHIATNGGASSSILALKLHRDIWPEVAFERTITLRSMTLTTLLAQEGIHPADHSALVLDTQGSELLVLKGASDILRHFRFIKTEAANFESYSGGCQLRDLEAYLKQHGFREMVRREFARRDAGGSYYDVAYERRPG